MSDTEAIMWAVEKDPALRSDFCNLTILEHAPDDEAAAHHVGRARSPRSRGSRQRVVSRAAAHRAARVRRRPDARPRLRTSAASRSPRRATDRALLDLCGALAGAAARPGAAAVGVHAHRRARRRARRAAAEGAPHDHRRRRRAAALARARRLRTPTPRRPPPRSPIEPDGRRATATRTAATCCAAPRSTPRDAASHVSDTPCTAATSVLTHPTELPGRAARRRSRSPRRCTARCSSPTAPAPTCSTAARCAGTSRCITSHCPRCGGVAATLGGSVNDVYVTGIAGALGRYHERIGSSVERAAPGDAGQHPRHAATTRPTASCPRACSCRSSPRDDPRGVVRRRARPARDDEERDRARRGRQPRRPSLTGLPTVVARRVHAQPDPHDRLRRVEPARQPGAALPRRRAHPRELSRSDRAPAPRSTSRCCATATSCTSGCNIDPAAVTDIDAFMSDRRRRASTISSTSPEPRSACRASRVRRTSTTSSHSSSSGSRQRRCCALGRRRRRRRGAASARRRRSSTSSPVRGCGCGRVEQVDERDRREHPRPAVGTRRHGRRVEVAGEREQRRRPRSRRARPPRRRRRGTAAPAATPVTVSSVP